MESVEEEETPVFEWKRTEHTADWATCVLRAKNPDLQSDFVRLPEVETYYQKVRAARKGKYLATKDKILISDFGCKSKTVVDSAGRSVLAAIVDETTPSIIWIPNIFPYDIEQEIKHDLIFGLKDLSNDELEQLIRDNIDTDQYEYVYFINEPHRRSIPDLFHSQVMYRKKKKSKLKKKTTSKSQSKKRASITLLRSSSQDALESEAVAIVAAEVDEKMDVSGTMKSETLSWSDCSEGRISVMRSEEINAELKSYKEKLRVDYQSDADAILVTKFGCSAMMIADSLGDEKKHAVMDDHTPTTVWRSSMFPFSLSPGISHSMIWSSQSLSDSDTERFIRAHLDRHSEEWCFTKEVNRSDGLPNFFHIHVFHRLRSK